MKGVIFQFWIINELLNIFRLMFAIPLTMLSHNTLIYLINTQDRIYEQEENFPEIIIEQDGINEQGGQNFEN